VAEYTLPFGKCRGSSPRSVPTGYLSWLLRACKLSTGLRAAALAELSSRPDRPGDLPPGPARGEVVCRACGGVRVAVRWQELAGGRRAIRADCDDCGRYVAFLPQTAANLARAGRRPGRAWPEEGGEAHE
jgi:hypothetical protein